MGTTRSRGRKAPPGVRPTPAKVREALFNILRDRIGGASFLELYAGTGLVGSEALVQGARRVVWVEKDTSYLRDRIGRTGPGDRERASMVTGDVHRFLRGNSDRYDIVFADPPYYTGEVEHLMASLASSPPVAADGVVILEHADRVAVPETAGALHRVKSYRYGDTRLSFYETGAPNARGRDEEEGDNG